MAKKNKGNNKGSYSNQNQNMNKQSYVNPTDAENCTAQQSDATNKKSQSSKNKSTGMQG